MRKEPANESGEQHSDELEGAYPARRRRYSAEGVRLLAERLTRLEEEGLLLSQQMERAIKTTEERTKKIKTPHTL